MQDVVGIAAPDPRHRALVWENRVDTPGVLPFQKESLEFG